MAKESITNKIVSNSIGWKDAAKQNQSIKDNFYTIHKSVNSIALTDGADLKEGDVYFIEDSWGDDDNYRLINPSEPRKDWYIKKYKVEWLIMGKYLKRN